MNKYTKHHRRPKSFGGGNDDENISHVPANKHRAYHLLFDAGDPRVIAERLNETWIDPQFQILSARRADFESFMNSLEAEAPMFAQVLKGILQ